MYNLKDMEDLISFNNDCYEAYSQCPLYMNKNFSRSEEIKILRGDLTALEVYKRWHFDDILWGSGYKEYLSSDAREVFRAVFRARKKVLTDMFGE